MTGDSTGQSYGTHTEIKQNHMMRDDLRIGVLRRKLQFVAVVWIGLCSTHVLADSPLLFNLNSLTYQQGDHYRVVDHEQEIWTFEHLSVWTWGDLFFFYDDLHEQNANRSSYYYEWQPRLSLGKLTSWDFEIGPMRDLLIASTYERGSDGFNAWLLGIGMDWKIPGIDYFSSNLYYRDTEGLGGDTWQATLVWTIPFSILRFDFLFDGYTDIRGDEGMAEADLNFNPQLKLDVGKIFGFPQILYGGIEYSYWNNKFGIDGIDERNVSGLLKLQYSFQ